MLLSILKFTWWDKRMVYLDDIARSELQKYKFVHVVARDLQLRSLGRPHL